MIETGIVGLGNVAPWHRRGLERTPGATLKAVADVDASRVDRAAAEWDAAGYADLDAMLDAESLDWVHVCTPVATHAPLAERALRAGAHVLVEKPVTATREGFEAVTSTADERGLRATVVHNQAYYPAFRRLRRLVASGEFGRVHGVSVRWLESNDPREADRGEWVLDLPGGEFGEGIAHPIYVALRTAGYPDGPDAVSVERIDTTGDPAVAYDGLAIAYRTADDVACTVHHHSNVQGSRQVEVVAEAGRLVADISTQSVRVYPRGYGPGATVPRPMVNAAAWTVRNAVRAVRATVRTGARRLLAGVRGRSFTVHDTHTPVIRREAHAIAGDGAGPTPRAEADWANRLYVRVNDPDAVGG